MASELKIHIGQMATKRSNLTNNQHYVNPSEEHK